MEDINDYIKNKLTIDLEIEINDYVSGYIQGFVEGFKKGSTVDRSKDTELMFVTKIILQKNRIADYEFCEVIAKFKEEN